MNDTHNFIEVKLGDTFYRVSSDGTKVQYMYNAGGGYTWGNVERAGIKKKVLKAAMTRLERRVEAKKAFDKDTHDAFPI